MKRVASRLATMVYALGIVAALAFGASQAFGRPVYLTCRDDGGTWLGACVPPDPVEDCTVRCNLANPWDNGEAQGECTGDYPGCCVCLLR